MCQNATLLRNAKILSLESIIKKIPTTKTRTASSRLSTSIFHRCTRPSLCSPSQSRRVFLFCLRLLLVNVHGPTSFQHLRTVNRVLCGTYREACQHLRLLENDTHWDHTLEDAVISSNAKQIRTLFSIILSTSFPSTPTDLWHKYKDHMAEDILHQMRLRTSNADLL